MFVIVCKSDPAYCGHITDTRVHTDHPLGHVMSLSASPPLAPITATLRWAAWVVENCRAMAETGAWNLENILTLVLRTGR